MNNRKKDNTKLEQDIWESFFSWYQHKIDNEPEEDFINIYKAFELMHKQEGNDETK